MQNKNENRLQCKYCGECCRNGGPALHAEDLHLIEDGSIELAHIVTLRPGERAYDQITQNVLPLVDEILKIKGRDGRWTCLYYSPEGRACGVYENRPIECVKLFCRDTRALEDIYDKTRLKRSDIIPEGHPLLELVNEHDAKCSLADMEEWVKKARDGSDEAGQALKEMVVFDMELRKLVLEKGKGAENMSDFLFGRPLSVHLRNMNVNVYDIGDSLRFGFANGGK